MAPRPPAAALRVQAAAADQQQQQQEEQQPRVRTVPTRRLSSQEVRGPRSRRGGFPQRQARQERNRRCLGLPRPPQRSAARLALAFRPPPPQAIEALYASQHAAQRETYVSFYSSELGGIVTDPALMVVQLDDHMLHRGHAGEQRAAVPLPPGFLPRML